MTDERPDNTIPVWPKIWQGLKLRCPNCTEGKLFRAYLKPVDNCSVCGEKYGHIRADDAPPYITLLVSGHLVIPLALAHIQIMHPPMWLLFVVWIPILLATILLMLPCAKGGTLALMWHLGLQGDEQEGDDVRLDREDFKKRSESDP